MLTVCVCKYIFIRKYIFYFALLQFATLLKNTILYYFYKCFVLRIFVSIWCASNLPHVQICEYAFSTISRRSREISSVDQYPPCEDSDDSE